MNEQTAVFEQHRRTLIGLAYRMLGTVAEAQDVVQDCYLKWTQADRTGVHNPRAWLVAACSRLALDVLKSARTQRETYYGIWLPEPFVEESAPSPEALAETDETVAIALLVALEQLSPEERTAFLLAEVFEYSFDEIAAVLKKSATACRQLATRARIRVNETKPRFRASSEDHRQLTETFLIAARSGDLHRLTDLLALSVELHSDGGGKANALPRVLVGAEEVAVFLLRVWKPYREGPEALQFHARRFNGGLGVLVSEAGRVVTALSFAVEAGRILRIYAVRNPDKLTRL